jgi:hypothetical protein
MPFMYDLKVGRRLGKFIADFDRIDDLETRKIIYKEIKDGAYSLDS